MEQYEATKGKKMVERQTLEFCSGSGSESSKILKFTGPAPNPALAKTFKRVVFPPALVILNERRKSSGVQNG